MNCLRTILFLVVSFGFSGSLWSDQSPEAFLGEADQMLTDRQLDRLIPRESLVEVARLAQEEDMEPLDKYLISDDTLRLLRRSSLIGTDFGNLMEEYQAECDRQGGDAKIVALSEWRSLWLEKVFGHLRYIRSLKPVWSASLSQTMDYTNNVNLLVDPDSPTGNGGLGDDDSGLGLTGGLTYMPLINHNREKNWDYVGSFSLSTQFQGSEEQLEYDALQFSNRIDFKEPFSMVRKASVDWNFFRLYSYKDNGNPSSDFYRHALTFSLDGHGRKMKNGSYFDAYVPKASLQIRLKDEVGATIDEITTFRLKFGWSYLRSRKDEAFSSLGWTVDYQQDGADSVKARDFAAIGLRVYYFKVIEDLLPSRDVNWNSSIYVRHRDYDAPTAGTYESEDEVLLSTSLNTSWSARLSSSVSLTYLNKERDVLSAASESIDQWKVMWMNRFITP